MNRREIERRERVALGHCQTLADITNTPTSCWQLRATKEFVYQLEGWPIGNAVHLGTKTPQE